MLKTYTAAFREAAEAYGLDHLSFHVEQSASRASEVRGGELEKLELADSCRLFIEGSAKGFAGGVFVEDFNPALIGEHLHALRESALECRRPFVPCALAFIPEPEEPPQGFPPLEVLVEHLREAENAARAVDSRIDVQSCGFYEREGTVTLSDGQGTVMKDLVGGGHFHIGLTAREGTIVQLGGRSLDLPRGQLPDFTLITQKAAEDTAARLNAASYPTGHSKAVLDSYVVCELLDAFAPAFFGKNVQNHMSILEGRLGQQVAGENITLEENPALSGGLRPRRFDDEGTPTCRKMILDRGILRTFLHNRRSAAQAKLASGGNGFRTSFSEETSPGYTNLILLPGENSLETLLAEMGDGLFITNVSGVFAGAHPTTGEFSLIARGYRVREGTRREAVSQITIAGDFFELLGRVRAVGNDCQWMRAAHGCVCTPSLYVDAVAVSGGEQA